MVLTCSQIKALNGAFNLVNRPFAWLAEISDSFDRCDVVVAIVVYVLGGVEACPLKLLCLIQILFSYIVYIVKLH